jgi:tRNA nucleotidyltransferase (CCA-adding enzyme)
VKIYLVGGAVRDELLDLRVTERDYLVVGATEEQMLERGFRRLDQGFPVFLHPGTGEEYALARRERKTGPGYKGFAVDAGPDVSLEEDLARRDLTINAMARDESGNLIDLFHGRDDLDEGILRHITPAFVEDPVRLLRVARFSAHLGRWGFRPAHETHALLKRMAVLDELATVVPERLREEMHKALQAEQPWRFFHTLQACGALHRLLPPLAAAMGDAAPGHGKEEAAGSPMGVLKCAAGRAPEPSLRLAALLAALPDPPAGRTLCRELRLERATVDLLDWVLNWPAGLMAGAAPESLLDLLERVRALQHPQRLSQLQVLWHCLEPGSGAGERLGTAARAAARISGAELAGAGWAGPQLGAELRRRRLGAIAEAVTDG